MIANEGPDLTKQAFQTHAHWNKVNSHATKESSHINFNTQAQLSAALAVDKTGHKTMSV